MNKYELFIVGAGAAGMAAAAAAWESGVWNILIVDRADKCGGILPQCLHNGFGLATFGEELTGPEYADRIKTSLHNTNIEVKLNTSVLSVSADRTAVLSGKDGIEVIGFESMILAAGCREITIGSLPISGTRPAGIFTAGQAQEMINLHQMDLGENIVILGSGDLGMIMARRFTLEGKRVIAVIEKEDHYGGMARNYHRCIEAYNIPLICSAEITEILGEERVEAVKLRYIDSGAERIIECDTLVTALGLVPERSLVARLGNPEWLTLCGNCSRVHDIVDSAVEEARRVGKNISR